jgi:hypothetical protein
MKVNRLIVSFLAAVASNSPAAVLADWGDTVDPTFECPALTSCKQVCVPTIADCPIEMLCSGNETETICPDGSCSESCEGHGESPCAYKCAPVACAKVDIDHDSCLELYGPIYDFEAECGEEEIAEEIHLWSFTEPGFVFFYSWICGVTVILLAWCAYNQRMSPVPGSIQPLEINSKKPAENKSTTQSWQTGYKSHPIGITINFFTVVTLLGIQGLLCWLCIQYYIQQEAITSLTGTFDDEGQVLLAFIITWCKFRRSASAFTHGIRP